eukprot:COSAG03_NODE_8219_length_825_cov_0.924242_1_plen_93_part_10
MLPFMMQHSSVSVPPYLGTGRILQYSRSAGLFPGGVDWAPSRPNEQIPPSQSLIGISVPVDQESGTFFHATIGSRMFIVTILFCPFDTKVCVR